MKIKWTEAGVIMICINNINLVVEAEIKDSHNIIITKNTKGRGVEAGIEGEVGNQVTHEDAEVINTLNPQEGIKPMKIPIFSLIIYSLKRGEAEADHHIQDTTTMLVIIITTEMKSIIMKRGVEIINITTMIIKTVNNTTNITTNAITKKIGRDLHKIRKDMVHISSLNIYIEDYRMKSGGSNYFRAPY